VMKAILGNHKRALRGCTLGVIILGALVAVIGIAVVYRISRSPALAQLPTFAAPSSKEAWRQDLEFLATEIPRRHKDAFHAITRNQFENTASELSLQIPSLNNDQIVVALMKITASIGDGHTHVETPPNFHSFPITLYWFDDSLRVTKASPEYTRALGARVVQVGDTSIDDALKAVNTVIPQGEGKQWVRRISPELLVCSEVLHGLGVLSNAARGQFIFEDDTGKRFSLDLETLSEFQRHGAEQEWPSATRRQPVSSEHANEDEWFTYLDAEHTLYFKFNHAPGYLEFRRFSKRLFEVFDRQQVERMVIDLRNNRGGDSTKFRWIFLPRLIDRRFSRQCFACPREINKPSELYVLVGRETYSAGMITAVELKQEAAAMLVGEPSGGRPDAYDEDRPLELPNSHLVVFVSTRYYRLVQDNTPGLIPDKEIALTWQEFAEGRDPVLEWVRAQ
jgi:C-terminal processing protease CtpA/Prc